MIYKTCRICGQSKPADLQHFYARKKYKGGWSHECRACFRIQYNERYGTRQIANMRAAKEGMLPSGRTAQYDMGDGVTLVRFGHGFKPEKAQTHGSSWGYSSALSNTRDAPG